MIFYTARRRNVRATQWHKLGDHMAVLLGVRRDGGVLDAERAEPFSRRYVEPGDWIVESANGRLHVLTPVEFNQQFEGL